MIKSGARMVSEAGREATGFRWRRAALLRIACLGLFFSGAPCARDMVPGYTDGDFGGVGLLQTPTARMAPEGELSLSASRVVPYGRLNVAFQPLSWFEGVFRYTSVTNRLYGADIAGNQSFKDKSIDLKVRLWQESRCLPDISVGARDITGTGLFSGQYGVASKRIGPLDVSFGLGWGYLGGRGDIRNPIGLIDSRFNQPPQADSGSGQFDINAYFRGRPAFFGGIEYQTPLDWLRLKVELDGNNYQHEPLNNHQVQRTAINIGALFRVNENVDVTLGYERGDKIMASINLHSNLATLVAPPKVFDPPSEAIRSEGDVGIHPAVVPKPPAQVDWAELSKALSTSAGVHVTKISQRGSELMVYGQPYRYLYPAQSLGRMSRVLDNRLDGSIAWFTLGTDSGGLHTVDTSIDRARFDELLANATDLATVRRSSEQDLPTARTETVLYTQPLQKFVADTALAYTQSVGGPNGFILYQVSADLNLRYNFSPKLWWDGQLSYNLFNNFGSFNYTAPSNLPRVRTYIRNYLTASDLTMPTFQFTGTHQFSQDWFGMGYGGMLETMYGGVGGEVLYRPFGERWALGMDMNRVQQRDFHQDFSFRKYRVTTGQATLYFDTNYHGILVTLGVGRYLAGDNGGTLSVSRVFPNGVSMGAYATVTSASGTQTGEGGFDKGIFFSIPFDLLLPKSSRVRANILWQPLLRDGGAKLSRKYTLYDLTSDRDSDLFDDNFDRIKD